MFTSTSFANNVQIYNKITFWDKLQKGANIFNQNVLQKDIKTAKDYGITFIRLAPDKFPSKERDFLIGNADNYTRLVQKDLNSLKKVLDICTKEKMPVILTFLSLPGSRWKQNNHDKDDLRLWSNIKFQKQAASFWKDLALELRNYPIIVGYNILNEPHPERIYNAKAIHLYDVGQDTIQKQLYKTYQLIIDSIRMVDQNTPIILDSSAYGDPKTFKHFKTHKDVNILYSFHMYEPYAYTNHKTNNNRFSYPGEINSTYWDKQTLRSYMLEVINFQKINHIPNNRILVGEFGCYRKTKGLPKYFNDLLEIFKENQWHFAFYAFREDTWDGMDYELGDKQLPWSYWQALEKGSKPVPDRKETYPQFKVLKEALAK